MKQNLVRESSESAVAAASPLAGARARYGRLRRLWWAGILLLGLSTGAVGWTVWQLRFDAIRSAIAEAGNIASVLAGQLLYSIQSIDNVLLDIKRSSKALDISDDEALRAAFNRKDVYDDLRSRLSQLPHVFNIAIADRAGRIVVTTAQWPTPEIEVADRDYFQIARADPSDQLSTSVPVKNRINGTDAIIFARRLETPSGAFAGIVFASVNTQYFEVIYDSTRTVSSLIFNLIREDATILFRHPVSAESMGRRLSQEAIWREARDKGADGYQVLATADSNVRYVSFRQIGNYPLFVNISVTEAEALASWYRTSLTIGLGSTALLFCSIFMLIAITRQVRELTRSESMLRESKQFVDALLDSLPARVFWKDRNLVYLGCNTPFAHDAGFDAPPEVIGKDDHQMVWRDQANLYRTDDRQVITSGQSKLLIEEPQNTPQGTTITLLTSKVPLRDSDGRIYGVLGTYLDVSERKRLENQLAFSNLLMSTVIENSPDGILVVDERNHIISHNLQFERLWKLPPDLMQSGDDQPVLQAVATQIPDPQAFTARIQALYKSADQTAHEEIILRDGRVIDRNTAPLRDAAGRYLGRIWYFRDISELKRANEEIARRNVEFDAAINNMMQGLLMFDRSGRLLFSNRRFAQVFGLSWEKWSEQAAGGTLVETIDLVEALTGIALRDQEKFVAEVQCTLSKGRGADVVFGLTDGRTFCSSCAPMADGGAVITFDDITEQRQSQERISYMAHHDLLTDLPNRVLFYEEMDKLLALTSQGARFAVLSLDLDHFKSVNDTFGHPVGDKLLRTAAERMRSCLREHDVVARLGGDEFAVLQTSLQDPTQVGALAARLIEAVSAPYQIEGRRLVVGMSIGIAVAPADGGLADQLMKNADLALYRCKADGGGTFRFFQAEMDERMQQRRSLELDLRKAVIERAFALNYQPIVNLRTGRITICEALLRWHADGRGEVPPLDFIPIAEQTGLIVPIGEWVLEHACADALTWPDDIAVAVNVSPVQFRAAKFLDVVKGALRKSGLPATRLELEITELVFMQDTDTALNLLRALKKLGVSIAMDDFGTGYSSLAYLRSFPFDRIKIDKSFIDDLTTSKESIAILRAVVGLGSSLNMVTTAEGVQTARQLEILRSEGCTDAQGYFFSPPKSPEEIRQMLVSLRGRPASAVA